VVEQDVADVVRLHPGDRGRLVRDAGSECGERRNERLVGGSEHRHDLRPVEGVDEAFVHDRRGEDLEGGAPDRDVDDALAGPAGADSRRRLEVGSRRSRGSADLGGVAAGGNDEGQDGE